MPWGSQGQALTLPSCHPIHGTGVSFSRVEVFISPPETCWISPFDSPVELFLTVLEEKSCQGQIKILVGRLSHMTDTHSLSAQVTDEEHEKSSLVGPCPVNLADSCRTKCVALKTSFQVTGGGDPHNPVINMVNGADPASRVRARRRTRNKDNQVGNQTWQHVQAPVLPRSVNTEQSKSRGSLAPFPVPPCL